MSEKINVNLDGVAKTLLIPLYGRAVESQRPDSMFKDDKAEEIVNHINYDFSLFKFRDHDLVLLNMRVREFDRHVRQFLEHNPNGVVVYIGCGLDTRFERVDNGKVEWFDLDMDEVITLRQKLIGGETGRYHLVSSSIFDDAWLEKVAKYSQRPFLFITEGVLFYFKETQVKSLVHKIREHFPISELVCDIYTPFGIWATNMHPDRTNIKSRMYWGMKHPKEVEKWGEGIEMLEEWYYFDQPEPRLGAALHWTRFFPSMAKIIGIFHYRLGIKPSNSK